MSTPQDYMDRLFSQASAQPTAAANAGRAAGLAGATGYGDASSSGMESDLRTLPTGELVAKYGYEATMQALGAQGAAAAQYNSLAGNQDRNLIGTVNDSTQAIADGFVNSVLGIAGMATGAVSDTGGAAVAGAAEDYNNWSWGNRTNQMRSRTVAGALRDEMRQRDNTAAYEADKRANGEGVMTDLRRIGREALSGGAAMFDDGTTFGEDVSQAIGSLATAGPVGKGITAIGKGAVAATRTAAPRAVAAAGEAGVAARGAFTGGAATKGQQRVLDLIDRTKQNAGTMASITAMEAGGAYNSTMQDVQSLSYDTLIQHSPVFAELIKQGVPIEDAKAQVANAAALQAAGWTGMMAAPLSALVARFEGNIFSKVPLGRGIANMGAESVEEGGIGLGGGLAQNIAVRDNADATRNASENVGEQVGQGVILGPAAAGVVQAPRMSAQLASTAVGSALDAVAGSAEKIADREQTTVLKGKAAEVQQKVEIATPVVETLTPEAQTKWNNIRELYEFNAVDMFGENAPEEVMKAVGSATNTPDAVGRMVKLAETTKDENLRMEIALMAYDLTSQMDAVLEDPDTHLVADRPEIEEAMNAMASSMRTAWKGEGKEKLRQQVSEIFKGMVEQGTPEQQVSAAQQMMTTDPLALEPEQIRTTLQHADNGVGTMSPRSRAALEASLTILEEDVANRAQMVKDGYTPTNNDGVTEQVRSSEEWGDGRAQSLSGHVGRLLDFVRRGSMNAANDQADHLANFAQHMSNKVEALNAHYAAGPKSEPVGYEQYTRDGTWRSTGGGRANGLGVTPQSKKSLQNARAIEADARMTVNTLNAMADAFPELNLTKLPLPSLAQGLQGSLEEVLERHRPVKQGPTPIKRGQTAVPDQAPPVPTPKPEPVKQEAPAPVAEPSATPEQVQAKKNRYAQQKAASKAEKQKAPPVEPKEVPAVSRVTLEQVKRLSDEGLTKQLQSLVSKRAAGTATPEDIATLDVLDAEMIEREDSSAVEVDLMAPIAKSRYTPEQAKKLSDPKLNDLMDELSDRRSERKSTPEDDATFEVLDAEMTARENEAAEENRILGITPEEAKELSSSNLSGHIARLRNKDDIGLASVEERDALDILRVEEDRRYDEINAELFDDSDKGSNTPPVKKKKESKKPERVEVPTQVEEEPEDPFTTPEGKGGLKADPEMVQRFPNLLSKSWFNHIFRSTEDSPLLAGRSPEVLAGLLNTEELTSLAPNVGPLSASVQDAYQELLEDMVPELKDIMRDRLDAFLTSDYSSKDDRTNLDVMIETSTFEHSPSGRVLNALESVDGEILTYNEEILNATILSAAQWFLNAGASPPLSADEWTEALGVVVNMDQANILNGGAHYENAIDEIAQRITRYLGIQGNNDAPQGMVQGVQYALAQEALESLIKAKQITITNVDIDSFSSEAGKEDDPQKRMIRRINVDKEGLHEGLTEDSNLIERMLAKDPEGGRFYVGDEVPKPRVNRHNQPRVLNTPEQMEVQRKMTNQVYTMNVPFNNFLGSLEKDAALHLFAEGPIVEGSLNKYDAEAKEGRNLGVVNALDAIKALNARMKTVDDDLSKVPVRYDFNFTSVNRMMMLGDSNPQANKVMRALMLPTWATADVTQGAGRKGWILGVAQGLGVKVHKQSFEKTEAALTKLLTGDLKPVMETLRAWQKKNTSITAEQAKTLRDQLKEAGIGDPAWAMFVLLEQARLDNASPKERKAFRTPMYLEADGVTNGPIMGMGMLMTMAASLDAKKLSTLQKGGVAIGRGNERMNYADMVAEDPVDLYQASGEYTPAAMADMLANESPQFKQHAMRMIQVMEDFFGAKKISIRKVDGVPVLHIDRGMSKNPLTITLYGSGARGIAGNFVDEMKVEYHKRMSQLRKDLKHDAPVSDVRNAYAARYGDASLSNLDFLRQNFIYRSMKDGLKFSKNLDGSADPKRQFKALPKALRDSGSTTEDMTFSKLDEINMTSIIQHLFVEPMRASIEQAVGADTMYGMTQIQQITSAQSELAVSFFTKALNTKLDEKLKADPDFRKADFLSSKELDALFADMEKIFPRVEINGMTFDLMGKMKSFLKNVYVSDILSGSKDQAQNRKIGAKTFGPASLGVGGIPSMIIGSGDGSMILKAYLADSMENTLSVYDGVHLSLDNIEHQSRVLNEQAYSAMLSNPIKAVWDSLKVTLTDSNRGALAESLAENLRTFSEGESADAILRASQAGKILRTVYREIENEVDIYATSPLLIALKNGEYGKPLEEALEVFLEGVQLKLQESVELANEMIEINHKVVASLGAHVDQMASGDAPARIEPNQEWTSEDRSYEEIAEEALGRVKTLMLESKIPIIVRVGESLSTSPIATKDLPALASTAVGQKLPSGATLMSMEHLLERSRASDLTPVQKEFMREALRSGALTGWSFVTGTPEQLSAYSTAAGKALSPEADSVVHGAIDLETKTVFLPETANETLVHEMVHAATVQNVISALTGGKVSKHVASAVKNLEGLLTDFMDIQPGRMPAAATLSYANARSTIERYLLDGTPEGKAFAINEMMAWVLGNKSLQEALAQKTAPKRVIEFSKRLFDAVKRMFWGGATMSAPANDFVSQLLFNSKVLANVAPKKGTKGDGSLQHSVRGSHLQNLKENLNKRLETFINMPRDTRSSKDPTLQALESLTASRDKLNELDSSGFRLSGEARDTAEALMTVLGTTMQVDPSVMNTAQRVYDHVMRELTPESFEKAGIDRDQASEMYDAITGKQNQGRDPQGRSLLLSSFMAMGLVSPDFRKVLEQMPAPKKIGVKADTFEQVMDNLGEAGMQILDRSLSGLTGKERNTQAALDNLYSHIAASAAKEGSWLVSGSEGVQGVVDKANSLLVSLLGRADKVTEKGIASLREDPDSKLRSVTANALEILRAGMTDEGAEAAATGATSLFNQKGVWRWARDLATDIIGRTAENAPLFDMIKIVRTKVQQMRQHYRDDVPAVFHKTFKNAPTSKQYASMSRVLGEADVASLLQNMTVEQVQKLLADPASLAQEVASAKAALEAVIAKGRLQEVTYKANQLVNYLRTGDPGVSLWRNSYAIAMQSAKNDTPAVVAAIDKYVTLSAMSQADQKDLQAVQQLMKEDSDAVMLMLQYNRQQLDLDNERIADNTVAKLNRFKGYLPNPVKQGQKLVVRPISEHSELVMRGYTRLQDYVGSSAERIKEPRAYYFSPVDGQAIFNQGLIQNTQQTVGGIQLRTGYSLNHDVAGRITNLKQVNRITHTIATRGDSGQETLMPVLGEAGLVVAYERSISRAMKNKIVDELHYGKALGMWRGRQAEEMAGDEINKEVVKQLKERYRKATATEKASEFINLRSMEAYEDPQIRDAASLFTKDVVEMFANEFGEDGPIWIERTMLKDVIGYRAATVGDMWTGTSRLSPIATDTIKDVLSFFMDKKAYQYAVNSERFIQGVVTDARVLIAVKSVIVPAVNIVSNMLHLISRGVPLHRLLETKDKLNEIHQYVQSEIDRVEAETQLTGSVPGSLAHRRLSNRLQSIEDAQKRLSIWPLIEAGEFSSVAEVGLNHEDLMLSRGRLSDFVETQLAKLPKGVDTVAHNLMLSKHTAIYRGLQRSVQYGDFVAKAVLYDHLVSGKGMTSKQALARITEEFVHYDRLPGRTRGYLESVGLLWFYNFKLRSVKVAFSTMRNNPFHTLLAMMVPTPDFLGTAGLPVEDNALTKLLSGTLGYSIGPGQGINSIGLNPWFNAVN